MIFIDGTWLWHNIININKTGLQKFDLGNLPSKLIKSIQKNNKLFEHKDTILCASIPINTDQRDLTLCNKRSEFFNILKDKYNFTIEIYEIDFKGRRLYKRDRENNDEFIPKEKCVDIALTSNLFYHVNNYDTAIVITGDKDFLPAIKKLLLLNKKIVLTSFRNSCSQKLSQYENKMYGMFWLDDILDSLLLNENLVNCESEYHEGDKSVMTSFNLQNNQKYFCEKCRIEHKRRL